MGLGAAIGAIGSIGGAVIQSSANKSAANQQADAAANALAQQKSMFGTATNALNPYINAGSSVLPTLTSLETPGTAASTLQSLPGFQFQSKWGTMAATNALAAEGLGGSTGPVAKAVSDYNSGLASGSYFNMINALQNTVNTGANAGSALAGNAVSSGNAMAGTIQNQGNARAAGTLGSGNALAGGLGGAGNSLLFSQLMGGGANGLYGGAQGGSFQPGYGYINAGNDQLQDAAQDIGL